MTAFTCIYCKTSGEADTFNREHVLQQGFGKFRGALVLHNAVCASCNSFFAGSIDLALTRDSAEGLERYRWGIKSPDEVDRFRWKNITIRAHEVGEFSGAKLRLAPGDNERPFSAQILPSAAVRKRGSDDWVFFEEDDILTGKWNTKAVEYERGLKLFGPDDATERMREALERQGVKLEYRRLESVPPKSDETEVLYEFAISPEVKRGIAKIAFNYLACRQGTAFVMAPAFDPIRQFVRFGEKPPLSPIEISNEVPFQSSGPENHVPVVHWISLESHPEHRNLLGVVALFTLLRYTVVLAEDFGGPWFLLPTAHAYNPSTLTAKEVHPVKPQWKHEDSIS